MIEIGKIAFFGIIFTNKIENWKLILVGFNDKYPKKGVPYY
jgi:hypothetical protein